MSNDLIPEQLQALVKEMERQIQDDIRRHELIASIGQPTLGPSLVWLGLAAFLFYRVLTYGPALY